jgi:hypothetical protein
MATKNLYCIDDVSATLIYAIQTNDVNLANNCAQELKQSGEKDRLLNILAFAWLLQEPGRGNYESLKNRDADTFLASLQGGYDLPAIEPRVKVPPPKNNADCMKSPEIPWKTIPKAWTQDQAGQLWRTIKTSLGAGYWEKAQRLTSPLLPEDTEAVVALLKALDLEYMGYLLETTIFLPLSERILKHAFYIAANKPTEKKQVKKGSGLEQGRVFHIKSEALKMWHIRPKPITDLMGQPCLVRNPNASQYWKDICKKFQVTGKKTLKFETDEQLEQFYSTCFPNDIPDEWSNEERAKSHGLPVSDEFDENPWFPAFVTM